MSTLDINSEWMEIDPKLKPRPEEPVIHKKYASNFFGTHLAQTLNYLGVDTLIVMGATACACVTPYRNGLNRIWIQNIDS